MFDRQGNIPLDFHLLDDTTETWVFGKEREGVFLKTIFLPIEGKILIPNLLEKLYKANRAILLVEGGANVLGQFLETGYWDEIRVIENDRQLGGGVAAPRVPPGMVWKEQFRLGEDVVKFGQSMFHAGI